MSMNPPRKLTRMERMRRETVTAAELSYAIAGIMVGIVLGILVS